MKTWVAILVVVIVTAAVRLPKLSNPREVVFDEVHFGKFVTAYCCTGQRFFDIHPPHAKLLIAGTAKILGYLPFDSAQGKVFDFNHIGQPYGTVSPIPLRALPALMGVVLPMIFFIWLRQLGVSSEMALLGALAVALDNALIVQTRLIALDGLLLTATFGALLAYSKKYYVLTGVLAGLAAGTKFTGAAVLALLGVLISSRVLSLLHPQPAGVESSIRRPGGPRRATREILLPSFLILLSALVVYLAGWWLHFALLPNPGPGDVWGVPTGNFWQDTVQLHKTMLSANYNLTATHPDESAAWTWPLMLTAIFYWSAPSGQVVYFLGNPVVWWGSSLLFLIALIDAIRKKFPIPNSQFPNLWIPLVGFLIVYVPLLRVPRALFLYHYLTPLLFALAFGLVWLDAKVKSEKLKIKSLLVGAVLLAVFFVLFSPLTYGLDVPTAWRQALYWLPGWR